MSRISQDFINSVGYLYEEINIQQNDFLNEESEYYDAEAAEIVEDILSTISTSMVYEGYSAEGIIGFLADSSEETIIEKYLSFDESILTESVVSEECVKEQLKLLEDRLRAAASLGKAAFKTLFGRGPGYTAAKLQGPRAPGLLDKGKVLVSKGVQKVKDIAQGAKAALSSPTAKKVAAGTGIFGLSAAGGYMGAKMAGAGGDGKVGPKIVGPKIVGPKIVGPKPSSPVGDGDGSNSSGRNRSSTSPSGSPKPNAATSAKPSAGETNMQKWARLHPNLAAKVKPGQSGYEEISKTRVKPGPYEKQDQTPTQGPSTAQIDTKSVDAAMKAEQERQKKRLESQNSASTTTKEAYEPYDIILSYLLSEGHADTVDEANYIMLEMDENAVVAVIEEYNDYLLAEEISEWVDGLLDEGYDLSEYSWDDIVEYYVNEARQEEGESDKRKRRIRRSRLPYDGGKGKRAEEIRQQWHKDSRGRRGESPLASRPRYQDEPGRRIRGQGYVRYSDHEN